MSRSRNQKKRGYNGPTWMPKTNGTRVHRSKERQAIRNYLHGKSEDVIVTAYKRCEDLWNWD